MKVGFQDLDQSPGTTDLSATTAGPPGPRAMGSISNF
jgi:hypothetical protein